MSTPLPPNDPAAPDEKLPGEAELAALYRQLPHREPDPALDAAVLHAAAHALGVDRAPSHVERRRNPRESGDWVHPTPLSAIKARAIPSVDPATRARRRVPHWLVALGSAASLVLVAGLAWHMRSTPTAPPLSTGTAAPAHAAAPPTAGQAADRAATAAAPLPRMQATEAARRQSMAARKQSVAPAVVAEKTAPPPPVPSMARVPSPPQMTTAGPPAPPPPPVPALLEMPAPAPAAPPADAVAKEAAPATAGVATPAEELARIEQLFAQGDVHEAQQRLLDFHRAHPQWPLSPELQAKLPKP